MKVVPLLENKREKSILIADDDAFIVELVSGFLKKHGYEIYTTRDVHSTLAFIEKEHEHLDAVLLDRGMPDRDALVVVQAMQNSPELRKIPVIMETSSDSPHEIQEGIDAGVFYYLTKPLSSDVLQSVLSAAMREIDYRRSLALELHDYRAGFSLVGRMTLAFRTLPEAECLAVFLSNVFPDRERVVTGLAELLINAVEHGHCGITYDEKTTLIEKETWREEVLRRTELAENKAKKVSVTLSRDEAWITVVIRDEGAGFAWKNYLQLDPSRAMDNHGKGIAHANLVSFDRLVFNDRGNEVSGSVRCEPPLDW